MNHKANKISTKVLVAALLLAALFCLCACVAVTGVTVDKTELNLVEGESVVVTATVAPEDADDKTVTWTTSDSAVATVDNGKITAIAEGEAIVTVTTTDGEFKATVSVTVTAKDVLTHVAAKAATCTASGNVEYWKSEKTGKYYSDAEGKTEITNITVEALGHTAGAAATCDQPQICTVCEQVVKAALGHTYGKWTVITEPTETTEGSAEKVCMNDNSHKETVVLPCLDESNGYVYTITAQPIGNVDGIGTYTYAYDNYLFTFDVAITATGHTWDSGKITVQPTCEEKGIKVYTCTKCGTTMEKTLVAYDHTYRLKSVVSEPTCTESGAELHRCVDCGDEKRVTTRALGHDGELYWEVSVEPTETTPGELVQTCGRDGCKVDTAYLPALDRENVDFRYDCFRIDTNGDGAYDQVEFTFYGEDKKENDIRDVNGERFVFVLDVEPFYVVTFLYRNQENTDGYIWHQSEVAVGAKVEVPSEIITEGVVYTQDDGYYFFGHWEYDGSSDVFDPEADAITKNTRVEAIYTRKVKVTVEDHDHDVLAEEYYEIGEVVAMPEAPACSGYRFNGWTVDSNAIAVDQSEKYIVQANASKDVEIQADCVRQYKVTFMVDGQQYGDQQIIDKGEAATEPAVAPEKEGYRFDGWDKAFTNVQSELTVNAKWVKLITVDFKNEGVSISGYPLVDQDAGFTATAPADPTKDADDNRYYRFIGWGIGDSTTPVDASAFENLQDSVVFNALYAKQVKVVFRDCEGVQIGEAKLVDEGKGIDAPKHSNHDDWAFKYWDTNEYKNITASTSKDVVINAVCVQQITYTFKSDKDSDYTVKFTVDKGDTEAVTAKLAGIKMPGMVDATDIYYGFAGWNTSSAATTPMEDSEIIGTVEASQIFYAIYVKQVKVTFVDHDGVALEGVEPQFVAIYSGANPPETYECPDPHHTFKNNWVTVEDEADYTAVMGNVKDVHVMPVCEASYAVKFVGEDGETSVLSGNRESLPVVEGNRVAETDIPAVTKEADRELGAYKFVGWTIKGTETVLTSDEVADKAIDADITFVATFELMPTFKVVGTGAGESASGVKGGTVEVAIKIMNMPKLSSMKFALGYDSDVLTLIDDSISNDEHPHYNEKLETKGLASAKPGNEYQNPNTVNLVKHEGDYAYPEVIVYFTFEIASDAPSTTEVTITLDDANIFHKDTGSTVTVECGTINCTVSIT